MLLSPQTVKRKRDDAAKVLAEIAEADAHQQNADIDAVASAAPAAPKKIKANPLISRFWEPNTKIIKPAFLAGFTDLKVNVCDLFLYTTE